MVSSAVRRVETRSGRWDAETEAERGWRSDAGRHVSGTRGAEPDETCLKGSRLRQKCRTDSWLKRRPRVFGRPVEDAWRRSRRGRASNRARVGGARRRASPERSLRSSRPGERCSTLRTHPRRRGALRPFGLAHCGESGARSCAALRVRDGPSGFLWRESREKPDSDSDYDFDGKGLVDYGRFCLLRDRADRAPAWQSTRSGHAGGIEAFQDHRRVVRAASHEPRRMNDSPRWPSALFPRRRVS